MSGAEKRLLALLGLPTFGLALAITTVTTYVPLLAQKFTSSTAVIGMVIAAEGLVALVVPIAAGAWSDQLKTRIGGRLPFLLLAAPAVGVTIAVMGFMHSLGLLALVVFVFFIAYYWAYEPYRALYPDMLTAEIAGRGQSTQAIFRGLATGTALIRLNPAEGLVCFKLVVTNAGQPVVAAHIHRGAAAVAGPVVIPLATPTATAANANVQQSKGCVSADVALIREIARSPAQFYVNAHTKEFPGGVVRGQLAKLKEKPLKAKTCPKPKSKKR